MADSFPPPSIALSLGAWPRSSCRYFPVTSPRGQRQVFSNFAFSRLDLSFSTPELGRRTPRGRGTLPSLRVGHGSLPARGPPPPLYPLPFPAPTFPSEQVARTEDAGEGRSISARLLPGAAAEGPRGGRAGRSPGCAARPRDWVRTGCARPGAGGGRGGSTAEGTRREGRPQEARGRAAQSVFLQSALWAARVGWRGRLLPLQPAGRGLWPAGWGVRVPSVGARSGDEGAPCRGGRAGRGRRREGPPRVPGEPALVSQLPSPASTAGLASERCVCVAGWEWGGEPLRVSSDISSVWKGSPARRSQDRGRE